MKRSAIPLVLAASAVGAAGVLLAGRTPATAQPKVGPKKELINPDDCYHSPYYTQVVGVRGGKTLYVSGQWSCTPKGELVGKGDLHAQAKQAFRNLKTVLAGCGARPADVVKINVYFVGYKGKDITALEAGLTECFGKDRSFASTVVGVGALARDGMLVEVEAVAVVD
jgi:enamine deaminase RidA (YjgF/YER057c/UK114 family)